VHDAASVLMAGKVLLLEDDADELELLAMALTLVCGCECVCARSYAELMQLTDSALGSTVALLDVNLGPQQPSGIDAYRWLRDQHYRGRVCFLTGHARSHPLVAQALAVGDAQLVEKPIRTAELCALVRGAKQ
jgi:DNA-binding response OmpR family regulator